MATTASADDFPIEKRSVKALALLQVKRTYDLFGGQLLETAPIDDEAKKIKIACKVDGGEGKEGESPARLRECKSCSPRGPAGVAFTARVQQRLLLPDGREISRCQAPSSCRSRMSMSP